MTAFLAALVGTCVLTAGVIPLLRRAQVLDLPTARSSHATPVPRGGGVAVVLALVGVSAWAAPGSRSLWAVLAAVLVLATIGMVDDWRPLGSAPRLAAQVVVGLVVAVVLVGEQGAVWWWIPVLALGLAGYVNAFNFMDGVNGISAFTGIVIGGYWALVGHGQGDRTLECLGLVLAGAMLGFLPWNVPRAKVFLGDVGSYGIGLFIACTSAWAVVSGHPVLWAVAPLVIYGADTGWVLVKRWRGGRRLTEPHREHVYQRLTDAGASHVLSAAVCAGAGAAVCAWAWWADGSWRWWSFLPIGVIGVAYLALPRVWGKEDRG